MAPIRKGDGTEVNLKGIQEVRTGDGRVFFEGGDAIPDSEDLHAHYDFSEEDGTMPVEDQTGNGFDLTEGSYSGVGVDINGVQAADFDGVDDDVYVDSTFSDVGDFMVFMVIEARDPFGSENTYIQTNDGDGGQYVGSGITGDEWIILSGDYAAGSDNPGVKLLTGIYESNDIRLREDGIQTANFSDSIRPFNTTTLGSSRRDNVDNRTGRYADVKIGEVLIYQNVDDTRNSDVEGYLTDKWGIDL